MIVLHLAEAIIYIAATNSIMCLHDHPTFKKVRGLFVFSMHVIYEGKVNRPGDQFSSKCIYRQNTDIY